MEKSIFHARMEFRRGNKINKMEKKKFIDFEDLYDFDVVSKFF